MGSRSRSALRSIKLYSARTLTNRVHPRRALDGVTQKVLSQQLRDLERARMITRRVYAEVPPLVEYALPPLGRTLRGPLAALCEWGELFIRASQAQRTADRLEEP